MKYNFDEVVNRKGTNSCKYDIKDNELPMWVADMDFHVLPEIKEAIINKANIDAYGYVKTTDAYFDAYIMWWRKHHHLELKKEWLIFSTGVVASIDSILKRVARPGDEVLLFTPVYNTFYNCIKNNGLLVASSELIRIGNTFKIDFIYLENELKKDSVKVCILCNPHNPTGNIWSKDDIYKVAKLCKENNVLLISDEIHCDITDPSYEYVPTLIAAEEYKDNIITLLSPTKVFNLAGLQTSIIVCSNRSLFSLIEKGVEQDDLGDSNYFAIEAAIAAFSYGDEWDKELRNYLCINKTYFANYIKENIPGLTLIEGHATYLLWVDISKYSNDSVEFATKLREQTGLWVCDGLRYGESGKTFIRINIATSLNNVKDACMRLKNFLI